VVKLGGGQPAVPGEPEILGVFSGQALVEVEHAPEAVAGEVGGVVLAPAVTVDLAHEFPRQRGRDNLVDVAVGGDV